MQIQCILEQRHILAEGPLWHPIEQALYWVDIPACTLHRLSPQSKARTSWKMPAEITSIGIHAGGGLIATLRQGFAHVRLPGGEVTMINEPIKNRNDVMFNDGKCDRQGRYWAGTKDVKEQQPLGSIYRLNKSGACDTMLNGGFTVSNGLAWSPDNKIMYICDSPSHHIYQYDFDAATGQISNKRIFATVPAEYGFPDGLTVDSEGHILSAHWNGWRITRYKPNGEIDLVIPMPVPHVTSCCFGGTDLKTLFLPTASRGLTADELIKAPQAGYLFSADMPAAGLAEPAYSADN